MSGLRQAAEDYLAMRRALGFKLVSQGYLLGDFVAYAERAGASTVTVELALAWALLPPGKDPEWCGARLSVVRGFAKHLQALDRRAEVPPADLLPRGSRRAVPYLYAPEDIDRLMAAARGLRRHRQPRSADPCAGPRDDAGYDAGYGSGQVGPSIRRSRATKSSWIV